MYDRGRTRPGPPPRLPRPDGRGHGPASSQRHHGGPDPRRGISWDPKFQDDNNHAHRSSHSSRRHQHMQQDDLDRHLPPPVPYPQQQQPHQSQSPLRNDTAGPISQVFAAVAASDLEYSGIMKPYDDGSYEPRKDSLGSQHDLHSPYYEETKLPSGALVDSRTMDASQQHYPPPPAHNYYTQNDPRYPSPSKHERQPWDQAFRQAAQSSGSAHHQYAAPTAPHPGQPPAFAPFLSPTSQGPPTHASTSSAPMSAPPVPSDKPPESAKKKRRVAKATAGDKDIPDGAEIEYEDPAGDPAAGPVFIHPPEGSVQACVRCHRIKRKCNGAWPRCASCTRADVPCVFELSAATSSYVHKLKDTNSTLVTDLAASQVRVQQLEARLAASAGPVTADPTRPSSPTRLDFSRLAESALTVREHGMPDDPARSTSRKTESRHSRSGSAASMADPDIARMLSYEEAVKAVQHYFNFNQFSYPMLEKAEVMRPLRAMYGLPEEEPGKELMRDPAKAGGIPASAAAATAADEAVQRTLTTSPIDSLVLHPAQSRSLSSVPARPTSHRGGSVGSTTGSEHPEDREKRQRFVVYMVLALGTIYAVRLGDKTKHAGRELSQAAMMYRARAVECEDILCVQSLMLLALWSMNDPSACSLWQALGVAGRVITAMGLHRRVEGNISPEQAEKRRRVFYAFFSLDRLVAANLSKPLTIADADIDIELPSQGPDDMIYRGFKLYDLINFTLEYRRLLGVILTEVYSVGSKSNELPEPQRRGIIMRLRTQLEQWFERIPADPEDRGPRTINQIILFHGMYYQAQCMLYRPSPLYPATTPAMLHSLYCAAGAWVDLHWQVWQNNNVSFHFIQIVALFVACICLLCSLCEGDARMRAITATTRGQEAAIKLAEIGLSKYTGEDDPGWRTEIRTRVAQCQDLFDVFGRHIPLSARYRDIFSRLSESLLAKHGGPLLRGEGKDAKRKDVVDLRNGKLWDRVETVPTPGQTLAPTPSPTINLLLNDPTAFVDPLTGPSAAEEAELVAGAWDAMTALWYDYSDLFPGAAEENEAFAPFDEGWARQWGGDEWWNEPTAGPGGEQPPM